MIHLFNFVAQFFFSQAGMIDNTNSDRLMLALEPEVAAIYCRSLKMSEFSGDKKEKNLQMTPNTTYMVVDVGGTSTFFIWRWFLSDIMPPSQNIPPFILSGARRIYPIFPEYTSFSTIYATLPESIPPSQNIPRLKYATLPESTHPSRIYLSTTICDTPIPSTITHICDTPVIHIRPKI